MTFYWHCLSHAPVSKMYAFYSSGYYRTLIEEIRKVKTIGQSQELKVFSISKKQSVILVYLNQQLINWSSVKYFIRMTASPHTTLNIILIYEKWTSMSMLISIRNA